MTRTVVAFFNNKGGVGKTSLVYHLTWMYSDLGLRVLAADLDPQANLTAGFVDEDRLEELWADTQASKTVFGCVQPLLRGTGDISDPHLEVIEDNLSFIPGDLSLSSFEDQLSESWPKCLDRDERAFRVISAFWRMLQKAGEIFLADVILIDLGPNLGAINRAALIAADFVVVPLSPDLFSLQGLKNLGPTLSRWRSDWKERLSKKPKIDLQLPLGKMDPAGYIVLQHSVRLDRPVKAYHRWMQRIPQVYREAVLGQTVNKNISLQEDPYLLATLKHYQSLMPLAQEARKPIFHLKPADGAIGSHFQGVQTVSQDFNRLAREIAKRTGIAMNHS